MFNIKHILYPSRVLVWSALLWLLVLAVLAPLATAQSTSSSSSSSSSSPTSSAPTAPGPSPTQAPTPSAPLPAGTRELADSQPVNDTIPQLDPSSTQQNSVRGFQTYHFAVAQQSRNLPVRRQLERIMFHPGANAVLEKRQQTPSPPPSPSGTTSTGASSPTRTIAPALPSPLANGTYAVFISVSTCMTPKSDSSICPPLEMYISTSASVPVPSANSPNVIKVVSASGLLRYTVYTTKEVFFTVRAPILQGPWVGDWNVRVGASTQGYVHGYIGTQGLLLDDSDSKNASFLTQNFTAVPTFRIYLLNPTAQAAMQGLEQSACAVETVSSGALTKTNLTITETNRISNADGSAGTLTLPGDLSLVRVGQRRQAVIGGLSRATSYQVAFVSDVLNQANAEVLYMMTAFKTKRSDNCMLITDLSFCQEVAYSVPVTSQAALTTGLTPDAVKTLYDEYAQSQMGSFENVLGRYDCSKSQYSLIRNCTDCTRAYRRWLCAVSIPKCTDVEDVKDVKNTGYVAPENMPKPDENPYLLDRSQGPVVVTRDANTTRSGVPSLNSTLIQPGDYAEVLPCIDLCFDVVQSCPNFLGFNCPVKNMYGNYGRNTKDGFQCNGLNLVPQASSATMSRAWTMMQVVAMAVVAMFVVL